MTATKQWMSRVVPLGGALMLAAFASGAVAPAMAQAPSLAMLDNIEKGLWQLRFRDGSASRSICVRSGRELVQIRHSDPECSRYVVEDGDSEVTVQYSCPGNGYGRTNIRKETTSLVQIESQGIANGKPFQFTAEGRRTGSCR